MKYNVNRKWSTMYKEEGGIMKAQILDELKKLLDYADGKDIQEIRIQDVGETLKVEIEYFKWKGG